MLRIMAQVPYINSKIRRAITIFGRCLMILSFAAGIACSQIGKEDKPGSGVKVKVPIYDKGTYRFEIVELQSLDNLKTLGGSAARFYQSGTVVNGNVVGNQPSVRLDRDSSGVYFALDQMSLEILTIYVHLEKLRSFDIAIGAGLASKWPKSVILNAKIPVKGSDSLTENNAFYSPEKDIMVFVPYSMRELPIQVNSGVIAHEHFHYLFESMIEKEIRQKEMFETKSKKSLSEQNESVHEIFDSPVLHDRDLTESEYNFVESEYHAAEAPPKPPEEKPPGEKPKDEKPKDEKPPGEKPQEEKPTRRTPLEVSCKNKTPSWGAYHGLLLRALNEGLADVWGWIYSDDTRFVERSRTSHRRAETMPFESVPSSVPLQCSENRGGRIKTERPRDLNSKLEGTLESCECINSIIAPVVANDPKKDSRDFAGDAYVVGSRMAKLIKQTLVSIDMEVQSLKDGKMSVLNSETKIKIGKAIYSALPKVKARFVEVAGQKNQWIDPSELVQIIINEFQLNEQRQCDFVTSKLNPNYKGKICEAKPSSPEKTEKSNKDSEKKLTEEQ